MRNESQTITPSQSLIGAATDAFVTTPVAKSNASIGEFYQAVYEAARERVVAAEAAERYRRRTMEFLN